MPRFYLHLYNGLGLTADDEGLDLPDLAAARDEAILSIRSLVSEEAKQGRINLDGRVEIAAEDGSCLQTIYFADAVALEGGTDP